MPALDRATTTGTPEPSPTDPSSPPPSIVRFIVLAIGAQATAVLPLALLGTMAVGLRDDLHFDEAALGAVIAVAFGVGALLSAPAGRVSERIGPVAAVRLATIAAAASMLGMATVARSWGTLVPFALLTGIGIALVQPSTDLWLSRTLPPSRQGFGFGTKQAAGGPGVGLLAGLAVPALAATLGWRAAFGLGAAAGAVVVFALGPSRDRTPVTPRAATRAGDVALRPLLVVATAAAIGVMSQTAFVGFIVSAAVHAGMAEGTAGLLFAAGCGLGFGARVLLGHLADRGARRPLVTTSALLGSSAAGFLLLATEEPAAIGGAMVLLCVTSWAWQGLFFLAVARSNPNAPATASGIASTGLLTGAVLGPVIFGLLVRDDYSFAWLMCAGTALVASALVLVSHHLLWHSPPAAG